MLKAIRRRLLPAAKPLQTRYLLFASISICLGIAIGLTLTELLLRQYANYIQAQERMDPGLLLYDPQLGWRLAPDWKGRHRHYDFDVTYSTNGLGLRGEWPQPDAAAGSQRRVALVGDSFTFGIGVNDGETFASLLGRSSPGVQYLNAGIPGYSTGQEYLFLKDRLLLWRVNEVVLVVFLANDLSDNTLAFPLQAEMAKPFFSLRGETLELHNFPVPRERKPPAARAETLATLVLGEQGARRRGIGWLANLEIARRLGLGDSARAGDLAELPERLAYPLALFVRIAQAVAETCRQQGVGLRLVLMPGQSFVERPDSLSAAFQDYLRRALVGRDAQIGVPVIDLATPLRARYQQTGTRLFYPYEGHLNPAGHREVADLLTGSL